MGRPDAASLVLTTIVAPVAATSLCESAQACVARSTRGRAGALSGTSVGATGEAKRDGLGRPLRQSRSTTLNNELLIFRTPLYSMKPSRRNLFMKKFTRERVVPTISARVSWESFGKVRCNASGSP